MEKDGVPSKTPDRQRFQLAGAAEFGSRATSALNLITTAIVLLAIGILYFGREIFVPFALAILFGFLLAPPVNWLRRFRLPRIAAVLIVVTSVVALLAGISILVGSQVVGIANDLPAYQSTMLKKIRAIRAASPGGGVVDRTTTVVKEIGRELSEEAPVAAPSAPSGAPSRAAPARTAPSRAAPAPQTRPAEAEHSPLKSLYEIAGTAMGPLATGGLVIVFVFFVLLSPADLRDRLIRLTGGDLHRTTEALNEAAARVGRYLLMQLVVNATYGIPLGIGLYLIGVPGAFLWAMLATLLRFIPYLGPMIAAVFPITMAFAVDPGWSMLLWTVGLVIGLELISNNVIEPWLYGSSTGMTPMAVILSAIFWTLLWGPVGLVLATPLTVCLIVMGHYVPQLKFIEVLLGSEPVLTPSERLYQRLLAGNLEEAIEIGETDPDSDSPVDFYDDAALNALRLAEDDRERISRPEREMVADGLRTVVQAMAETERRQAEAANVPVRWYGTPVLCVAGRGELDLAAATLMVEVLHGRGIGAREAPSSDITPDTIGRLDLAGVEVVCLSYLSENPKAYARFVCRRLKSRAPHIKIVLGTWNSAFQGDLSEKFAREVGADSGGTTLNDVATIIEGMVGLTATVTEPPPVPEEEKVRMAALEASGALHAGNNAHLDRVAHKVAEAMNAPIGLVSLTDDTCQVWKGAAGLPDDLEETRQCPREMSICTHVVAGNAPLVVEDTSRDRRFAGNSFLRERGIRFYAGVPLRTEQGQVIGSLCVMDFKPRTASAREVSLLQVIADELMDDLPRRENGEPQDAESPVEAVPLNGGAAGSVANPV
jgi:predicted PurR-regulated permease PerM